MSADPMIVSVSNEAFGNVMWELSTRTQKRIEECLPPEAQEMQKQVFAAALQQFLSILNAIIYLPGDLQGAAAVELESFLREFGERTFKGH